MASSLSARGVARVISARRPFHAGWVAILGSVLGVALTGCTNNGMTGVVPGVRLTGSVYSGSSPVSGARVQLFAAGQAGDAPSTALLSAAAFSDANGKFTMAPTYSCPSALSQVYAVASGGTTVSGSGASNPASTLMFALGDCSSLGQAGALKVDEVSTVSTISLAAPFMKSAEAISAGAADRQGLREAFLSAQALTGIVDQLASHNRGSATYPEAMQKVLTLANVLSSCTGSAAAAGASTSACEALFAATATPAGSAPRDTAAATLAIFQHPSANVDAIYALRPAAAPFAHGLSSRPESWSVSSSQQATPAPVPSLPPGSYYGPQTIALTDSAPGALLYYNVGGVWYQYTGPGTVLFSVTLQAMAVGNTVSPTVTGTYDILPATISVATPASATLGATGSGVVTLSAPAPATGTALTLTSSAPAVATVSPSTVSIAPGQTSATFSFTGLSAGTTTVRASAANGYNTGSSSITIAPPVSVVLTPGSVALSAAQTQLFAAAVSGTSNAAVTWTLNPSVGTISASGLYTAPVAIAAAQSVTVTATSNADPTKSSQAVISLRPSAITVAVSPGSVSMAPAQTQSFTASVLGVANTAVSWSLTGSGCSGSACGTISSGGLYTAPASLPTAATVTITATSLAAPTVSGSATALLTPSTHQTYYLAPASAGGNDANSGLSPSSPWLSPNHSLHCGDTIVAAASTAYSASNFGSGRWGAVTCTAGNSVAWLQCATFDGCKISASRGQFGMYVDRSYWGVAGWEITVATGGYSCFAAAPSEVATPVTIHHIIFANDIASGCQGGGFSTFNNGQASVDYVVMVGDVAYNAAQGSLHCYSGFSIYQPAQSDSAPGTHIYLAGNFAFGNRNPSTCNGTAPTDGEGIIFDTFDGSQGGMTAPYLAQAVQANNILVANGGRGSEFQQYVTGATAYPTVYRYNNTLWGNSTDPNQNTALCADMDTNVGYGVSDYNNLIQTNAASACGGHVLYGYYVYQGSAADAAYNNWIMAASGAPQGSWASTGYTFGPSNSTQVSPGFVNPTVPSAPQCGGTANVPACMSSVIANFKPSQAVAGYGYQKPLSIPVVDPLFPQWVCHANLPSGLVTMGCQGVQ